MSDTTRSPGPRGKLVVVSGPSGVGKSTVVKEVLARFKGCLERSVSATTRQPRPGEQDGLHYYFLSDEEFHRRRAAGAFVESVEVFGQGYWYGTLWSEVRPSLEAGKWVLLEIDVEGAEDVLASYADTVSIFIKPASAAELERRLRSRATESESAIERRLEVAQRELALADKYEFQVINDTVPRAVEEICQILQDRGILND